MELITPMRFTVQLDDEHDKLRLIPMSDTTDGRELAQVDPSKLDAYYYSFEPTGHAEVDTILAAVALAGKRYHSTEEWNEWGYQDRFESPVETIERIAIEAARRLERFAPVRIDPEDESTWPTEGDYALAPYLCEYGHLEAVPCIEVWDVEDGYWCPKSEEDITVDRDFGLLFTWRRINNDKP